MIQGRSALTDLCRSMLRFIDDEVSIEERGFIIRRDGVAVSLSTSPGEQA